MNARGPLDRRPTEPGWWLASDGRWYPPESAPAAHPWALPDPGKAKRRPRWVIPVIVVAVLVFGGCSAAAVVALRNDSVRETITALREGADRFYTSDSEGMAPSLDDGDRVAATSQIGIVERGDVLVVKSNRRFDDLTIRRVIGLPGESIESRRGRVFVDGTALPESYLPVGTLTSGISPQQIPLDSYFVLGDNRVSAVDSRTFGPISRDAVAAVVLRILTPATRAGPVPGSPRR